MKTTLRKVEKDKNNLMRRVTKAAKKKIVSLDHQKRLKTILLKRYS